MGQNRKKKNKDKKLKLCDQKKKKTKTKNPGATFKTFVCDLNHQEGYFSN